MPQSWKRLLSDKPRNEHMVDTPAKTLAIGAAGKFAGLVVPELAKRGAHVRGMVQDAKQGKAVRKHGAADVVVGDLRDRASLDAALQGVGAVFYIAPAFLDKLTIHVAK